MPVKTAVVTGGNKGIGYGIVKGLCEKYDGIVYLTARDVERGQAAVAKLKELDLKAEFHQLDIDDQASIDRFRDFMKEKHGGIDVLVNNAAIAYKNAATEPFGEQAENTIRVNFFDLLAVCRTLFPILRPNARVVNVSSSEGKLTKIAGDEPAASELRKTFADPNLTEEELCDLMKQFVRHAKAGDHRKHGWPNSTYAVSKVGVSALSFMQQRAFDADPREDLVVNAVHPGYVDTDMTSHKGPLTIEQGAEAPLYLALLPPNVDKPRGAYVWNDKKIVTWDK